MTKDFEEAKYIRESSKRLCENRCSYKFKGDVEEAILAEVKQRDLSERLICEIVSFLHSEDGNVWLGAAEILGTITPASMVNMVVKELEKHLDDNFIRDYVYSGFQGDEEDVRTVAECSEFSIQKLRKLVGK